MRDSEDSGNIIKSPSNQDLAIKISFSDESVKATKLDEVTKFPNENNKPFVIAFGIFQAIYKLFNKTFKNNSKQYVH